VVAVLVIVGVTASGGADAATRPPDQWAASSGDAGNSATNLGERTIVAATAHRVGIAWDLDQSIAPEQKGSVVLGGVVYTATAKTSSTSANLLALSAGTGRTLWRLQLPADVDADGGVAVSGHRLLVSYAGIGIAGGVLAVDLTTRHVVWRAPLPRPVPGAYNFQAGKPYTDGTRVYTTGAGYAVVAYRLTDGHPLWHVVAPPLPRYNPPAIDGMAVSGGFVFVVDGDGLVALRATSGHRVWKSSTAFGPPVVAAGRVFTSTAAGISAYSAKGCAKSVCHPLWSTTLRDQQDGRWVSLQSADKSSVFVTYATGHTNSNGTCFGNRRGHVARLSARTGGLLWRTTIGMGAGDLVRGGDTVWFTANLPSGSCDWPDEAIVAYPATSATTPKPLVEIRLPEHQAAGQSLAIASGTLLYKAGAHLLGARSNGK
jgi:outer membrane protein assembly factor BamB